jgi:hypothetical protein
MLQGRGIGDGAHTGALAADTPTRGPAVWWWLLLVVALWGLLLLMDERGYVDGHVCEAAGLGVGAASGHLEVVADDAAVAVSGHPHVAAPAARHAAR